MILRRLVVPGDPPVVADLQTRVTVLRGLGPDERRRLVDAVTVFFNGRDSSALSGVIEVQGAAFEIEQDLFDLLELPANLPDIVIRAGDLKRVLSYADEKIVTTSGRRAGLEDDLDRYDRRFGRVAARRSELTDLVDLYGSEADDTPESVGPADEEDVHQHDEPGSSGTFVPERGWAWTTPDPYAPAPQAADGAASRAEEIETEIAEIRRQLDELDARAADGASASAAGASTDPERAAVSAALEAFRWVRSWLPEAPPEAVALADRIVEVRREQSLTRRDEVPEWLRDQARQALEDAQAELARAEREVRPRQVPEAAATALEEAHAAVDEAEERARRRMAGPIAARRLAAAKAQEEEILAQLGLPSYAAFLLLRASSGNVDADGEQRLAAARAGLADAEAMWAEVNGEGPSVDADVLREREHDIRAHALELLGADASIAVSEVTLERLEALLRDQRMPAPDWRPAAEGLVEALLEAGVDLPPFAFEEYDGDYDRVDELAAAWLAVSGDAATDAGFHETERVRQSLLVELDDLERRLDEARAAETAAPVEVGYEEVVLPSWDLAGDQLVDHVADREAATEPEPERQLSAVERLRLLRDQTAAQLDVLAAEVSALTRIEDVAPFELDREIESPVESPEAELAEAEPAEVEETAAEHETPDAPHPAVDDDHYTTEVDAYLAGRFAALRDAGPGAPLPMLFDEVLEGQPHAVAEAIFDRIAEESQTVQVVMLSDDDRVAAWAAGLEGGAVIDGFDDFSETAGAADDGADVAYEADRDSEAGAADEPQLGF